MSSVSDYFGSLVFDDRVMRANLSADVYASLRKTIDEGSELDIGVANAVADAMKKWAVEKGATHFTHWFQPLTGITAEKHDSFISTSPDGSVIMEFSGKELIKGEPDASSFPSGGLRTTFEARGYTAWDPTSYAFIKGKTLCIPTAFCSYGGHALDKKTPLLRSMEALSKQALRILRLFGNTSAKRVVSSVGPEQEYFLISKEMYDKRPDLRFTGRTLFGAKPPKGQELDDHYFGVIKPSVAAFMEDLNDELWKLGILAKTEHNEVAPSQHELAPIYTTTNIATDHNQLTMEIMQKVAVKHGLVCLLHEKPFAGVNGSGKHNNWSVSYGGKNLLDPGSNPDENALFLTVLCAIIEAVDKHADLLRASVAGAGNDHRLGANEAPPAVISIYLGDQLADVIERLEKGVGGKAKKADTLKIGVDTLPALPKDATDRNRTSPFAFTGNKFEFRAPGSSVCCAGPTMVLNTIVAEAVDRIAGELEGAKVAGKAKPGEHTAAFHNALQKILQETLKAHSRIIFNGNGYEAGWLQEAEKRGLPNAPTTPAALAALDKKENRALFEKYGVMTARELKSRHEIFIEEYATKIRIEGTCARDMASEMILPAVKAEYAETVAAFAAAERMGVSSGTNALMDDLVELGSGLDAIKANLRKLDTALVENESAAVLAAMQALRTTVDSLEHKVSDKRWPLPKYRDMLFLY
ncbi:MAG: glutamine synthetase III [Lachnospiraceae bacterium]|nr:glutamine synthetase III [Lachnospiraceae bacterium]